MSISGYICYCFEDCGCWYHNLVAACTLLLVSVLLFFLNSSFSSSHHKGRQKADGFSSILVNSFSNSNLTYLEQAEAAVHGSFNRYCYLQSKILKQSFPNDIDGISMQDHGVYNMVYLIGTPPTLHRAILDTASEITWLQCLPCELCFKQSTPIIDPEQSSSYKKLLCDDDNCRLVPQSRCHGTEPCFYSIQYGDGTSSRGELAIETLTFSGGNHTREDVVKVDLVSCSQYNRVNAAQSPTSPGLIGLSRLPGSLISQLNYKRFSYCFSPSTFGPGTVKFGLNAEIVGGKTRLLTSPTNVGFYYLNLEGISVNDSKLPIPTGTFELSKSGSGGMIIDSAASFTFLKIAAHNILTEAVGKLIEPIDDPSRLFDLCFAGSSNDLVKTPSITFHFTGVDVKLNPENIWLDRGSGAYCLAMIPTPASFSVFGVYQQRDFNIGYDLENEVISLRAGNVHCKLLRFR